MKRLGILRSAQLYTFVLGAMASAGLYYWARPELAQGLAVGAVWSAANLRIMEGLMGAMVVPRDRAKNVWIITIWFLLKMAIYVLAVWLLIVAPFPVVGMSHGLTVMLTALVIAGLTTRSREEDETNCQGRAETGPNVPPRGDDAHA